MFPDLQFDTQQELLRSICNGDRTAFGRLYDKYAPALFGAINKMTDNKELSEDILQQSFFYTWQNIESCKSSKQPIFMWMLGIARNLVEINLHLQKNKDASEILKANNNVYSEQRENSNTNYFISQPAGQKVIDLICFKGYSINEAAQELKMSASAINTQLRIELDNYRN